MFLVPAVILGVLAGLALGGRLGALAELQLRLWPAFFAAIGCQLVAFPSPLFPVQVPETAATALSVASYACLVAVTAANARLRGMVVAGAGMCANLAAILANGGHMPALPSAMREAGIGYHGVYNNSVADAHPSLPWLVDRWAAPAWIPAGNVFSAGDVLIAGGIVLLVASAMGASLPILRRRAVTEPAA
jgi:uncharacterized protein DUF5317